MRTGHSPKLGRLALLAALVLALLGTTLSARAGAVDPIGPAPAAGQTWIVTLADHVDAPSEAPRLVQREGGHLLAVYSHVLDGFAFTGSAQRGRGNLPRDPRVSHTSRPRGRSTQSTRSRRTGYCARARGRRTAPGTPA